VTPTDSDEQRQCSTGDNDNEELRHHNTDDVDSDEQRQCSAGDVGRLYSFARKKADRQLSSVGRCLIEAVPLVSTSLTEPRAKAAQSSMAVSSVQVSDSKQSSSAVRQQCLTGRQTSDAGGSQDQCHVLRQGSLLLAHQPVAIKQRCSDVLLTYSDQGCAFYVPASELKVHGDPAGEPWFFPVPLTALQASVLLSVSQINRSFMVYCTDDCQYSLDRQYCLAVCATTDVLHYNITRNREGSGSGLSVEGHQHSFLTLSDLISYFQHNRSSLATRLGRPLSTAHLPVSLVDTGYELARSQLSVTGDIIGKGRFGVICVGQYRGQPVAIKVCVFTLLSVVVGGTTGKYQFIHYYVIQKL